MGPHAWFLVVWLGLLLAQSAVLWLPPIPLPRWMFKEVPVLNLSLLPEAWLED